MKYSRWDTGEYFLCWAYLGIMFIGTMLVFLLALRPSTPTLVVANPPPKRVVVDAPSFKGEAILLHKNGNTITVEIDGKTRVFSGTFSYEYQMVD